MARGMGTTPEEGRSVSLPLELPHDGTVMGEFSRRVAAALGLGEADLFPTQIKDAEGKVCDYYWCADGWTPEGISVFLVAEPDQVQLCFGEVLRERPLRVALREAFRGGDMRLERL